jgi:hypothetical protein
MEFYIYNTCLEVSCCAYRQCFEEVRRIVSPEVAAHLDPEARYGVWWSGRRAFERKLVFKNGPDGAGTSTATRSKSVRPEKG